MTKSEYDRQRYLARYVDCRPASCKACGRPLTQPKRGRRLYCSDSCKAATWRGTHPQPARQPVVNEPFPSAYMGHEVFQRAREVARISGIYTGNRAGARRETDWGQHDILGEATLAILEGRDPAEAVRRHRANEKAIQAIRTYVSDVGWDGHRIVVQRYGEEEAA